MQSFEAAVAKDGFFEPFQAEEDQDNTDCEAKIVDRYPFDERNSECGDDYCESGCGGKRSKHPAAPVDRYSANQNYGKCLDEFNCGTTETSPPHCPLPTPSP